MRKAVSFALVTSSSTQRITQAEYAALAGLPKRQRRPPKDSADYQKRFVKSELSLQRRVEAMLDQTRLLYMHQDDSRRNRGKNGFPDIYASDPEGPDVLWWELKDDDGQPSPEQLIWLEAAKKKPHHHCAVFYPQDIHSIRTLLIPFLKKGERFDVRG